MTAIQEIRNGSAGRWLAAVGLGLGGSLLAFVPLQRALPPYRLSLIFSIALPMLAAQAWGWRHGLVAATLGLAGQFPWFLWRDCGWGGAVLAALATLWFGWHGWLAESPQSGSRLRHNP